MRRPRSTDARCDDTITHSSTASDNRHDLQPAVGERVIPHHLISALNRRFNASGVERSLDLAVECDADASGLLGHDDGNGIILFGQPDRGAMPRAKVSREQRVDGQRKEARGRGDAIVLHDDGAIVQRRFRLKDAHEQIVGKHRVERKPCFDVIAQARSAAR